MEHRHLLDTSQVFDNEQDQNWNQMHTEQPYVHMGMFSSAENGPLYHPMESMSVDNMHIPSNWNSSSRFNGYSSVNQNVGASHYTAGSLGSGQSPFLQTSNAESLYTVPNNYASYPASSSHDGDGQSLHYVGGNYIDLTTGNGGLPHKRKSPGIPTICERGSTSRHYSAGSSSNQPTPSGLLPEKRNMNYQCMPWYGVNSDPSYRGSDISIRGEDEGSIRNVRSRSAINLEPIPGSSHLLNNPSQSSLSHHHNYASSVELSGSSSGNMIQGLAPTSMNSSHGSIMVSDSNSVNQFLVSGGAASVDAGGYHQDYVPSINLIPPQNINGTSMQSVTGACSSYLQGPSPILRPSSSSLRLGHMAHSEEGLRLVTGSYLARDPRLPLDIGRHNAERNGRSRIFRERYRSEPNGVAFHNRLTPERHMTVDRSVLYGPRSIPDQHRDMRLDVDHMSYEELLALGERIGSVNTGLAENMISKCLTESIYCSSDQIQDEETCAICLEEYKNMDDVGTLKRCGHDYHVSCIKKWLSMKNQCPICKGSALPNDKKAK